MIYKVIARLLFLVTPQTYLLAVIENIIIDNNFDESNEFHQALISQMAIDQLTDLGIKESKIMEVFNELHS